MNSYQLELKQIVDYPKCRIYREFIRTLSEDRNIRVSGSSGLYCYTLLCSYVNFRTSYKRIDGINFTVFPGEWICRLKEMQQWFRCKFQYQVFEILEILQKQGFIYYQKLCRGHVVKFKIRGWEKFNRVLDYNAPCQKDDGFFFLPIHKASELISMGRCSEADIVLDLWIHTIYNDKSVEGSDLGPVVYMRNGSGNPMCRYSVLADRWGISKSTVSRILNKLHDLEYVALFSFNNKGSLIYLKNYLSTMFKISDVMLDKEEVALSLNLSFSLPGDDEKEQAEPDKENNTPAVSKDAFCVSKTLIDYAVKKVLQILSAQGFVCSSCDRFSYMLSPLSYVCRGIKVSRKKNEADVGGDSYLLELFCSQEKKLIFELTLTPSTGTGGASDDQ